MKENKLTPKQEKFCQEYIVDLNGKQAAIRAGYSKKTAEVQASKMLSNPKVQEYVSFLKGKREERTEITGDRVVEELAKIAFMDAEQFFKDDGDVKLLSELDDDAKSAVSSYSYKRVNLGDGEYVDVPIIKMHDKLKALELLGKHIGIFEKDNKQKQQPVQDNKWEITFVSADYAKNENK